MQSLSTFVIVVENYEQKHISTQMTVKRRLFRRIYEPICTKIQFAIRKVQGHENNRLMGLLHRQTPA